MWGWSMVDRARGLGSGGFCVHFFDTPGSMGIGET